MMTATLRTYYRLTKPGIIYGNVLTATGGFLLASKMHIHPWLLLATLVGTSLVIASGCVINNYMDRGIDKKMARTKKRALVTGAISSRAALIFATVLGVAGFVLLARYVNALTVYIGIIGFVDYVALYGISKRRSVYGTIVGSISGATPVLAGYCAVRGHVDAGALIVFLLLVLWQMPHFYAIAMYRRDDYAAADIPVLPVKWGMRSAKVQILVYIAVFGLANVLLAAYGYVGYTYVVVMSLLTLSWLGKGLRTYRELDDKRWGRTMFFFSLIVILALSVMLSVGGILP